MPKIVEPCAAHPKGWLAQGGGLTNHVYGGFCKCGKAWKSISPGKKYCSDACRRAAEKERKEKRKARKAKGGGRHE